MKPSSSTCTATVAPQSDGTYGIRFTLVNATSAAVRLDSYQPFTQFQLRAAADGAAVPVEQPALDIPVQKITLTIPASGALELTTPIRLRIAAGVERSRERFVWSIDHAAKGLQLTFQLVLAAPFDQPCTVVLD